MGVALRNWMTLLQVETCCQRKGRWVEERALQRRTAYTALHQI